MASLLNFALNRPLTSAGAIHAHAPLWRTPQILLLRIKHDQVIECANLQHDVPLSSARLLAWPRQAAKKNVEAAEKRQEALQTTIQWGGGKLHSSLSDSYVLTSKTVVQQARHFRALPSKCGLTICLSSL
mmetsp:Transcript_121198/g.241418  ORF Transcript_121198/g.241418 Transcript_121198/m.241418 type:complete len:130 (-) Transcript_121198:617-1006(-)